MKDTSFKTSSRTPHDPPTSSKNRHCAGKSIPSDEATCDAPLVRACAVKIRRPRPTQGGARKGRRGTALLLLILLLLLAATAAAAAPSSQHRETYSKLFLGDFRRDVPAPGNVYFGLHSSFSAMVFPRPGGPCLCGHSSSSSSCFLLWKLFDCSSTTAAAAATSSSTSSRQQQGAAGSRQPQAAAGSRQQQAA